MSDYSEFLAARTIVGALSSCCFWHALVSLGLITEMVAYVRRAS